MTAASSGASPGAGGLSSLHAPSTSETSSSPGRRSNRALCAAPPTTMTAADTAPTVCRRRSSGAAGSSTANAAPVLATASMVTTVHIDFSKHSGTTEPGRAPRLRRAEARRADRSSSRPYVSCPSKESMAGASGLARARSRNTSWMHLSGAGGKVAFHCQMRSSSSRLMVATSCSISLRFGLYGRGSNIMHV